MVKLTPEQCEEFWAFADKDKSGSLSLEELDKAIVEYNPNTSTKACVDMFVGLDSDGNNTVTKAEFINQMQERTERGEGLCKMFLEADKSGDGYLSTEELTGMIKTTFKENADKVLKKFFEVCDNGDGKISFDEFKSFFD